MVFTYMIIVVTVKRVLDLLMVDFICALCYTEQQFL